MNKYHNLYQIVNDFSKIDQDEVIVSTEFDLEYFQTVYNAVSRRFDASTTLSTIDNKKTLGNLYIQEFLNDFADYWKTIDSIVENTVGVDLSIYREVKRNMVKILRSFSIYKGTEFFIKFVYDLYATLTTTSFWTTTFAVESFATIFSNFKNLEYNLTGSLPSHIWESVVKPTVHPAGWVCNYFGNEYNEDYDIVSYDDRLKNDLCYIDYAGCNTRIDMARYYFDVMEIYSNDLSRLSKKNFQFDVLTVVNNGTIIETESETII